MIYFSTGGLFKNVFLKILEKKIIFESNILLFISSCSSYILIAKEKQFNCQTYNTIKI